MNPSLKHFEQTGMAFAAGDLVFIAGAPTLLELLSACFLYSAFFKPATLHTVH